MRLIKKYVDAETAKNRVEINRVEFDVNADILVAQNQIKTKADKTWVNSTFYKTGKQLDMGGEKITNLTTPTTDSDVVTKTFVDDEVALAKRYTIDLHSLKDEFRYLMEDVNESSSESGIQVAGIVDYANSPRKFNKKAYDLQLVKNLQNEYVSRLGFNM